MSRREEQVYILGGGVTGLAAGVSSGFPVLEAKSDPGGICSSYYVRPGDETRLTEQPADEEVYRFEIGGGHWIFGGDPVVLRLIRELTPVNTYRRHSAVYFAERDLYVPYPLQNHLRVLGRDTAAQALKELVQSSTQTRTMKEWLEASFGETLCELFFFPFHERYTAGLYERIAPQDPYKSPVKLPLAIEGAFDEAPDVGYNVTFVYPREGLNVLAQRLADRCDIRYDKRVVSIDVDRKEIHTADGSVLPYTELISTLPLNKAMEMAGLSVEDEPHPYTSVLVLNIGAVRGRRCPDAHWLYNPDAKTDFHRVGFYSNVDRSFLPRSARETNERVSIYVERAYVGGRRPTSVEVSEYADDVVNELQEWGFIEEAEVVDPTWIDVAYTWAMPDSKWKPAALAALEEYGVYQVGRYGRWVFQGIADSIHDGLTVGASFRQCERIGK